MRGRISESMMWPLISTDSVSTSSHPAEDYQRGCSHNGSPAPLCRGLYIPSVALATEHSPAFTQTEIGGSRTRCAGRCIGRERRSDVAVLHPRGDGAPPQRGTFDRCPAGGGERALPEGAT